MKKTMDRRDTLAFCFALAALLYACAGCDAEGAGDAPGDITPSLGAPRRGPAGEDVGAVPDAVVPDTTPATWANGLTFGTGLGTTGSDLIGAGTTFSAASPVYFRLESADDMGGRAVRISINGGAYSQKDYTNPQASGHTLLSSFSITDVGTFTVDGSLVGPAAGALTKVATATITVTP